ncbi:MAG: hypothetical protein R2851_25075 [Caldilineaceae bacterium]
MNAALVAAVANVIHMVQPDVIVIGGLLSAMPAARFAELEADIQGHLPPLIGHNAIIRQGKWASQNGAAKGAILHFLQAYLNDSTLELDGVARG